MKRLIEWSERQSTSPSLSAAIALSCLLALSADAHANSPDLNRVDPPGYQRGQTVELTLRGRRLDNPQQVVFYDEGIEVLEIEPENNDDRDDRRVKVKIRIAPDAPLGEHRLRLRTRRGWTHLRTFFVGDYPVVNEEEDNSAFDKAQPIDLNRTVHGVVEQEDVDYYRVEANEGQRISAEVEAIRLGGPMFDPHVAIVDADKFELDARDDTPLLKQDAYASAIAPVDGIYYIRVREAAYRGGGNHRYRLHVGNFPRPAVTYPLGGPAGQYLDLQYIGDVTGPIETRLELPDHPVSRHAAFATHNDHTAPSPNWLRVSPFPNLLESEPNNNHRQATAAEQNLPLALNGILEQDGDHDWFRFEATEGQRLEVRTFARGLGSAIDPVINLFRIKEDGGLEHLVGNDDADGSLDSFLNQQIPADGEYTIRVRDQLNKGGPAYAYRVEVTLSTPSLELLIPEVSRNDSQSRQFASVPKGNRWGILLRAQRGNFGGPLDILAENLPDGVTMHAPRMPGNVNQIPIVFEAEKDADLAGTLATLRGRHAENESITGTYRQVVDLVRGNPNATSYYSTRVDRFAAGVTAEAPFKIRIVEPKVPLVRFGRMNLKIKAERDEGFDAPIVVELPFRPPGMGARSRIQIPEGETEATYPINANGRAAKDTWPLMALAHASVEGGPLYVASQIAHVEIADPIVRGKILMAAAEQGDGTEIICELNQQTDFDGEAELTLGGLPNRVSAEQQTLKIDKDTKEVVWQITTEDQAPVGKHKSLQCNLVLVKDGERIRQNVAGGGVLRIDKPRPEPEEKEQEEQQQQQEPEQEEEPKERLSRLEKLRKQLAEQENADQEQ